MLDLLRITDYNRTRLELEEFFLLAIVVAGKRATIQQHKLMQLKAVLNVTSSWRDKLTDEATIRQALEKVRMGQYNRITKAFHAFGLSWFDLRKCPVSRLEAIPGVGLKTSRFFILHSRPFARVACLDTHILQWLRDHRWDTPETTPTSKKKYRELEKIFLQLCGDRQPAELDLAVWCAYSHGQWVRQTRDGEVYCFDCMPAGSFWESVPIMTTEHYFPTCEACGEEHELPVTA